MFFIYGKRNIKIKKYHSKELSCSVCGYYENDDFFLLKSELKSMLDNNVINSVDRDYGTYQGFHRLR